jgi:hypothetical protein
MPRQKVRSPPRFVVLIWRNAATNCFCTVLAPRMPEFSHVNVHFSINPAFLLDPDDSIYGYATVIASGYLD